MSRQHRWYAPLRRFAFTCLFLLGIATTAFAQFDRGTITGTIKDSQGGIVPGATVTATSTQNQQSRTTVTDGSGYYTFPNLSAGRYELLVELSGFKKVTRSNVQLDAAGSLALDFTLETGALTEEVTVTAEQSPLQSDVALRKTIEAKDIEQIAFNGRNPIGVAGLKAGVVGGSFNNNSFSSLTNGGFSINGSRGNENNITVDGATAIRTRASGSDHRRSERGHDPGDPGSDRRLHARIRTCERRPDPHRHEERQQPLQRERVVFHARRQAASEHVGKKPEHERAREQRAGPVRLQAVRATRSVAPSRWVT